ncbi:dihydrodipicolinate synthase family protein (plasmid) [Haloarcula salina]|uniref:dihydrodipicolinate synthase family protein n=1 Tax=Haloarcula salina TaxID=1429914 RepID=UPI003C6FA772
MPLSASRVQEHLRGVAVGLLTPFDEDGEINHDELAENVRDLYDEGIHTFLATANISEYHSLSHGERVDSAETAVEALPDDACVLAGVGGSGRSARKLLTAYDDVGVDAHMVMPLDHTYVHEMAAIEYYRDLADTAVAPLVPYARGFDPSVTFLAALTRVDGVVGIKYAIEDPVTLGEAVAAGADDVVWVNGLAEPYAVSLWAEGVEGFSAGVSNFRPEIGLELLDALRGEDWEYARELRDICLPYQRFRDETGSENTIPGALSVPAVKKGLELAGFNAGAVRPPIRSLSQADERRAEELYNQLDDDVARVVR